jgi:hypothetical protein
MSLVTPFSFFIIFWVIHYLISPKVHVVFYIGGISAYYIGGAFVDPKDCATIMQGFTSTTQNRKLILVAPLPIVGVASIIVATA